MTELNDTERCNESTRIGVNYVLDQRRKRRYRRNMATPIDVKKIPGKKFKDARDARGLSQREVAERIGARNQQTIDKIERDETEGGGTKYAYAVFLGLQPSDVNDMTTTGPEHGPGAQKLYNLPFFKPRAARGNAGSFMSVPKEAESQIKRPHYLDGIDPSYAIEMADTTMVPRYEQRDILYVDPTLEPTIGHYCIFFSPSRQKAVVRMLAAINADSWIVRQLVPSKEISLPKKAWPHCERIQGSKHRDEPLSPR
jgi:transcriptional regulator with XRE-family HTH domain